MRLLYSAPEEATRELLARAIANPEVAQQVLSQASPRAVQRATGYTQQNTLDRLQGGCGGCRARCTPTRRKAPLRGCLGRRPRPGTDAASPLN